MNLQPLIRLTRYVLNLRQLSCINKDNFHAKWTGRALSAKLTFATDATSQYLTTKDDMLLFIDVFPHLVRDLTKVKGEFSDIPEAMQWFSKVLNYNVPGGKNVRGVAVVMAYKMLAQSAINEEDLRLAQIAGWCIEMLNARLMIDDDLMDGSLTRRNRPCWYRTNNLGVKAINDGHLVESGLFLILEKYFRGKPYYMNLVELFHDAAFKTFMGQCLDIHCLNKDGVPRIEVFSIERHNAICKYKTGCYTFHLPLATAMHIAGISDSELHNQAEAILLEMSHFWQVQDDYLDCYGNSELTGKEGTDIEEGKCSWLVVVALERANQEQRQIIKECYGKNSPEMVARIKQLYDELGIPEAYVAYEKDNFKRISSHIERTSDKLLRDLLMNFMVLNYRRDKLK